MKTFHAIILLSLAILSTDLNAQRTAYLNVNNVSAGIGVGGNLFSTPDTFALLEVPKGSAIKPLFTSALWMTGFDNSNLLHCSANTFFANGFDFFDGPISANYNPAYDAFYNRVFKITKSQIQSHTAHAFPISSTQVDASILYWPSIGNPYVLADYSVSINSPLAPFFDTDGDNLYDPVKGDYPLICGEEGVFFVFNDDKAIHTETNGLGMKLEIRGMAEVFTDNSSSDIPFQKRAINNTVFVRYEIENKSLQNWQNFSLGFWEDPDLGCYNNDRVGCDTIRNLMFAYNGTSVDNDCGQLGYHQTRIAHGIEFLNSEMKIFGVFTGLGAAAAYSDPSTYVQYRSYETAHWNDGSPFTEGGLGHGGITPTNFLFPGSPNDTSAWSDVMSGLPSGDRRMFGTTEFHVDTFVQFNSGVTQTVDFAFIGSYDSTGTNLTVVDTLKRDADEVKAFYNNVILLCRANGLTGIENENNEKLSVSVYPNPTSSQFVVESVLKINALELLDLSGRIVWKKNVEARRTVVDVSCLQNGVYLLQAESEGKRVMKKVVIE